MYYWHTEFKHHGQDFVYNLWADNKMDVELKVRKLYGVDAFFYKIERIR